ncbi:MAG: DUF3093 domain-containing protein [Leucobacter sp.]
MTSAPSAIGYRERLWPGLSLFIVLLLIIPAVTLMLWPVNAVIAMPVGILLYALIAGMLVLTSPVIEIAGDRLTAGRATIPISALGSVELMGADRLRAVIGPDLDARSYLVVRGWIHQGVKIENIDEQDPAPHWILTSRTPQKLAIALRDAQAHS